MSKDYDRKEYGDFYYDTFYDEYPDEEEFFADASDGDEMVGDDYWEDD